MFENLNVSMEFNFANEKERNPNQLKTLVEKIKLSKEGITKF